MRCVQTSAHEQTNDEKREVNMLKRVLMVGVIMALLMSVGLAGFWLWGQVSSPVSAQDVETGGEYSLAQTITVLGQGSVRIKPDVARASVGVETSAESVSEAVAENETNMESILTALRDLGLEDKDIQTMNYSIQLDRYPETLPRADSGSSDPQPVYRVSNMVNVTIRDLDKVGDVLDAVIEAGANNIWGVSFSLDDPKAAQGDARADAIADAQARAEALADLSGVQLGPVMSVSEVLGSGASPMPVAYAVESAAAGGASISPGELEVSYQVQVAYFIER
jgi:uncharacterized protein YggE